MGGKMGGKPSGRTSVFSAEVHARDGAIRNAIGRMLSEHNTMLRPRFHNSSPIWSSGSDGRGSPRPLAAKKEPASS